jgi:hypothetical protein
LKSPRGGVPAGSETGPSRRGGKHRALSSLKPCVRRPLGLYRSTEEQKITVLVPKRIQIVIDFVIEVFVAMVGFFAMYLAAIALNYFNDIVDTKRLAPIPILYAMRGVEYAIFIADLAGFGYFLWTGTLAFIGKIRATN